jgi:hypothetical protein
MTAAELRRFAEELDRLAQWSPPYEANFYRETARMARGQAEAMTADQESAERCCMTTASGKVKVTLGRTNVHVHWPCHLCGGSTQKESWEALIPSDDGDGKCFVCRQCIEAGAEAIPERLLAQAQQYEAWAAECRREAEAEYELPTVEDVERLMAEARAEYLESNELNPPDTILDSDDIPF